MNLETLVLELVADDSKLSRDIDATVNKAIKKLATIEKTGAINPSVNFKSLHELNKLLDIKQQHIKETARVFSNTPIVVKVDASAVNKAKSEVAGLKGELSGMSATVKAEITHKFEGQKNSEKSRERSSNAQENHLKQIVKNTQKGGLTSMLMSPFKMIATGMAEGIGIFSAKSIVAGFESDVKQSLEKLGANSFRYLYQKGVKVGDSISNSFGFSDGLSGLSDEIKEIAKRFDSFSDPDMFAVSVSNFEDAIAESIDLLNNGDYSGFKKKISEAFNPTKELGKEIALRTSGVGLRVASQPVRIKNKASVIDSARTAQSMAQSIETKQVDVESQKIAIVTGGIDFNGGRNTDFAANVIQSIFPNSFVDKVYNADANAAPDNLISDLLKAIQGKDYKPMPVEKLLQNALGKGVFKDSIEMAAKAIAYRQQYPDKPIELFGTSGGSYVVENAIAILEKLGIQNVKGVGLTAPMMGLTGNASNKNFRSIVGELDPLFVSAFGGRFQSDPNSRGLKKTMDSMPVSLPYLMSPDMNKTNVVKQAGLGHHLAPFVSEEETQAYLSQFLDANIPDYMKGKGGRKNLNFLMRKQQESQTIPRTIAAMIGNSDVIKQVASGDPESYAFVDRTHMDWRRDNDLSAAIKEIKKKAGDTDGAVKSYAEEYIQYLDELLAELTQFFESKGKTGISNELIKKTAGFYPDANSLLSESINRSVKRKGKVILPDAKKIKVTQPVKMNESFDIWDENYSYDANPNSFNPTQNLTKSFVGSGIKGDYVPVDPFGTIGKSPSIKSDGLITINQGIYKEVAAIHALLKTQYKPIDKDKLTRRDAVIQGEFVDLAENNKLQKMLKGGGHGIGNAVQQLYGAASGVEQFVFDAVKAMSLGAVDLNAAKRVTQTVAPGVMLGMAAHSNPMLGAGMDMLSSNVVTPLLSGGGGALLHGVAGLLPEGLVSGASTIAHIAGRIPGSGMIAQNAGMMGASAMGGLGTLLTYLGVGRGVSQGAGFLMGQAAKPFGLLPQAGQGAQNATYNALTGTANVVGGVVNGVNQLRGASSEVKVPLLPPRQVEYAYAEIVPSEPRQLSGSNRMALPPSNIGSGMKNITEQFNEINRLVDNAIGTDSNEELDKAIRQLKKFSDSFKDFYPQIEQTLKEGNLRYAKIKAQVLLDADKEVQRQLDAIAERLNEMGVNTNIGTGGRVSQFGQVKSQFSQKRNLITKKGGWMDKIQKAEGNADYVDIPTLQQTLGQKANNLGTDNAINSAQKLMGLISQLEDIDLNALFTSRGSLNKIGKEIMAGLNKGIADGDDDVINSITELAEVLPERVKKVLGIKSPSRVFQEIGEMIVQGLQGGLGGINDVIGDVTGRFSGLIDTVKKFGLMAVAGVSLALLGKGLYEVGKNALTAYQNLEGVFIASKLLAGSEQYIADLRKQALQLGSDLRSTLEQGIQFSSALVGTPLEAMSQQMFQDFSTSLSYLGLQQQQYDSALLALKQVASKGRVSLEEITGQLGEAVPGIMPLVADALGTNVQGAIQQIESGNVLAEDLLPKLAAGLKNRTAGLAPIYERSFTAAQGRLGTSMESLNVGIGEKLAPAVIPAINTISAGIIGLSNNVDTLAEGSKYLALGLAGQMIPGLMKLGQYLWVSAGAAVNAAKGIDLMALSARGFAIAAKPLLLAFAAISAFELVTFTFKEKGSQSVMDTIKSIDKTLLLINPERKDERTIKFDFISSGSGLLDFLDKVKRSLDLIPSWVDLMGDGVPKWIKDLAQLGPVSLIPNFGQQKFEGETKRVNDLINEAQRLNRETSGLSDPNQVNNYVGQLNSIDQQISVIQGRMTALRLSDAQKNAPEVDRLQKQISGTANKDGILTGGLTQQRQAIEANFVPGGLDNLKRNLDELKTVRDELEATKATLDPSKMGNEIKTIDSQIAGLNGQIQTLEQSVNLLDDGLKELGNTINAQRLSFINLSGAIAQSQQNYTDSLNAQRVALTNSQVSKGLQSQVNEFENLSFAVFEAEQNIKLLQQTLAKQKTYINSGVIDKGAKATVEQLAEKSLDDINLGDVTRIKALVENDQGGRLKAVINDSMIGVLEEIATANSKMLEAQKGLSENKKALAQFQISQEDYFRNTARQIYDLSRQAESQKIQDQRSIEDFAIQLRDTSRQLRLSNRALIESYQDLGVDFNLQIATLQKGLLDAKDQLRLTELKTESFTITPGNSNSAARQINAMVMQYTESLFNTRSNERQIKIDVLNLEKERIARLRQIRGLEEQQVQAMIDYENQVRQTERAFVDLNRNLTDSANNLRKSFDDLARSIKLADASTPAGKATLQALNNIPIPKTPSYIPNLQSAPVGGAIYGIQSGTGQVSNQRFYTNQPIDSVPSDFNRQLAQPVMTDAKPYYNGSGLLGYFSDSEARQMGLISQPSQQFDTANYQPGDRNILTDYQNANINGGYRSAPVMPDRVQPVQQQSIYQQPKPVQQVQSKALPKPQSKVIDLPRGYESIERLANTKLINNQYFNLDAPADFGAMALALATGATEAFGYGTQRTDWFTRMGGTGNRMKGFGQANQTYHAKSTATPDSYMNWIGGIFHGDRKLPNSKGQADFAQLLANQVQSGQINNGQDLIRFTQSRGNAGLAGTSSGFNWQGLADGWGRNPGLADALVNWLKQNLQSILGNSNLSANLNFGVPESIELGQTAQAVDPRQTQQLTDVNRPFFGVFDTIDRNSGLRETPEFIQWLNDNTIKPIQSLFDGVIPDAKNEGIPKLQSDMDTWNNGVINAPVPPVVKPNAMGFPTSTADTFTNPSISTTNNLPVVNKELNVPNVQLGGFNANFPKPPEINTAPLINQANVITEMTQAVNYIKSQTLDAQKQQDYLRLVDSILGFNRQLEGTIRNSNRALEDQARSIDQMKRSSKGYLTMWEKANQAGIDTFMNYENQIRSIEDKMREINELVDGQERIQLDTQLAIAEAQNNGLPTEQLNAELNRTMTLLESYGLHRDTLAIQKQELETTQGIATANSQNRNYLQEHLNYIDKMVGLMGSISSAKFDLGGTLVNDAPILQARMQLATVERRATLEGENSLGLSGEALADYVALSQELAEVNYQKSFAEAIPFVKELGANLKEAVFQTGNFGEALSKVLDVVASQVFDQLVLKPFMNLTSQWTANIFGIGMGAIPGFAGGLDEALTQETRRTGQQSMLAVINKGESVLSTLNGDAQKFQALKRSGQWDAISLADGTDKFYNQSRNYRGRWDNLVGTANRQQSQQTINKFNQTYTIVTPNADSFRKSQSQIQDEGARTYRRKMR